MINRVDPHGRITRRQKHIKRRVYDVQGPHHLWHIDGNHKLIHFHIVIHGGIDGFSRACMYLGASNNNTAHTACQQYILGVERYGLPSRIRIDFGGENVLLACLHTNERGINRGSVLTENLLKINVLSVIGEMLQVKSRHVMLIYSVSSKQIILWKSIITFVYSVCIISFYSN